MQSDVISETAINISGLDYLTEYFWRVKAINTEIESEWSEIWSFTTKNFVSVENLKEEEISIYPNPTSNYFYIFANNDFITYEINIIDISGKIIYKSELSKKTTMIYVNNYPAGIYFVNIITDTNIISKQLIIHNL